jgi:hypothetical protein
MIGSRCAVRTLPTRPPRKDWQAGAGTSLRGTQFCGPLWGTVTVAAILPGWQEIYRFLQQADPVDNRCLILGSNRAGHPGFLEAILSFGAARSKRGAAG